MAFEKAWHESINGNEYYIKARLGRVLQVVKVRDGYSSYSSNTLGVSRRLTFMGPSIDDQVSNTLSKAVSKREGTKRREHELSQRLRQSSQTVREVYEE